MNISDEAVEAHFPEPRPCGNDLCDQDHDGPCWTCGETWPCAIEKNKRQESAMNAGPEVSAEAVQELKETPGLIIGSGGRLLIQWEDELGKP